MIRQCMNYIFGMQSSRKHGRCALPSMHMLTVPVIIHRPFQDAVHAGTANIMCSYNRLNNSGACQNSKALNGLLKTELGFQGFVVSDWDAQPSGVGSALAGLDVAMPASSFWGANLTLAISNGTVNETRLDDMVTRYAFIPLSDLVVPQTHPRTSSRSMDGFGQG